MIPVEKQFLVIDESTDTSIGVLDEAFMAEYGKPGTKFIIRGSPWQIIHATEDKVYVRPVDDPTGSIPSWIGEEIPVPYNIAQELAEIRGFVEEKMQERHHTGRGQCFVISALSSRHRNNSACYC